MQQSFNPVAELREAIQEEIRCESHPEIRRALTYDEADLWWETVQNCSPTRRLEHLRWLGRNDLYFLVVHMLKNRVMAGFWPGKAERDPRAAKWFFDRAQEVQEDPDGYCDEWSRSGGKSTLITYAKTIQDILIDPEKTFCILSHVRPIAKDFAIQIKTEFEQNQLLKDTYPDILYQDPQKEAVRWSADDGIVVKRKGNPREATLEAYGLVDGMPTGKHFTYLIYDDVVTERTVTTPDMIEKALRAVELSINLAATRPINFRMIGTPYAEGDPYATMIERGFAKPRLRPAVVGDESLLWDDAGVAQLKQSMSPRMWALQILLDPKQADKERGFKQEWLRHWEVRPSIKSLNRYIFVDPGGKGEESTSYTAMVVVGLGADHHIYILDMIKDRLSLLERGNTLFQLHREYIPMSVFYEKYSMQADVEFLRDKMNRENYRFLLSEVGSGGTQLSKERRIEKIQPDFSHHLILLPPHGTIRRKMYDGKERDLVENFINNEYLPFPYSREKDLLDALSRMKDPSVNLIFPKSYGSRDGNEHWQQDPYEGGSWQSE